MQVVSQYGLRRTVFGIWLGEFAESGLSSNYEDVGSTQRQPLVFFADFSGPCGDSRVDISECFCVFIRLAGEYCRRRCASRDGPPGPAAYYEEAVGDCHMAHIRSWWLGGHARVAHRFTRAFPPFASRSTFSTPGLGLL